MKVAIVHDELVRKGGAEQVVLSFHKAFPEAPIITLAYNPNSTYAEFKNCRVITSWFGRFIKDDKNLRRFFFPFGILAMKRLVIKDFDVILQSTTHCSKYVKVDKKALVVTYCHTPFRLVWLTNSYNNLTKGAPLKKKLVDFVIGILKGIDKRSASKTDWFVTNAREVVPRILNAYKPKNPVTVINPPVVCKNFRVSEVVGDYFLVVSRFEPYKKVDLVIKVFNELQDKKLVIVGSGSMKKQLEALAGSNVTIMCDVDSETLANLYSKCKALIFPQLEDYGITPLEANASGRPVIAYGKGGVLDTMIPYNDDATKATALFFPQQTKESLKEAILKFETLNFCPTFIRKHAEEFDESYFVDRIKTFVQYKVSNLNTPAPTS